LKCVWVAPRCVITPLNTSWARKRDARGKKIGMHYKSVAYCNNKKEESNQYNINGQNHNKGDKKGRPKKGQKMHNL
jgi:hypothetical protein